MNKIAVVGSANMDMTVVVSKFPQPGETIIGKHFEEFPGGKGANQAVCCARLGVPTYFLGKLGTDGFKEALLESMAARGVLLEHVITTPASNTGVAFITVDDRGQNQIIVVSGSNMELRPEEIESHQTLFDQVAIVLTQLEIPLETVARVVRMARRRRLICILNPAPARELPEALLRDVDYLVPNETELSQLTGFPVRTRTEIRKAAQVLIGKGVRNVIVTLGNRGAVWLNGSAEQLFPARRVPVRDTTAAGDAFCGALAVALARSHTTAAAIEYANLVASLAVTRMGAQTSMPTEQEVHAVLNEEKREQ